MDVHSRSVLIITLLSASVASAEDFHESLRVGVVCSSDVNMTKFEILESPATDGFFAISRGLCKALPVDSEEHSTLFPVGKCLIEDGQHGQQFTFLYGGWLNMLTVRFDEKDETEDLICR